MDDIAFLYNVMFHSFQSNMRFQEGYWPAVCAVVVILCMTVVLTFDVSGGTIGSMLLLYDHNCSYCWF